MSNGIRIDTLFSAGLSKKQKKTILFVILTFASILFQTLLKAEEKLDAGLREILSESGAEEYAPILAMRGITSKQIGYMKDKDLVEVSKATNFITVFGVVEYLCSSPISHLNSLRNCIYIGLYLHSYDVNQGVQLIHKVISVFHSFIYLC